MGQLILQTVSKHTKKKKMAHFLTVSKSIFLFSSFVEKPLQPWWVDYNNDYMPL